MTAVKQFDVANDFHGVPAAVLELPRVIAVTVAALTIVEDYKVGVTGGWICDWFLKS